MLGTGWPRYNARMGAIKGDAPPPSEPLIQYPSLRGEREASRLRRERGHPPRPCGGQTSTRVGPTPATSPRGRGPHGRRGGCRTQMAPGDTRTRISRTYTPRNGAASLRSVHRLPRHPRPPREILLPRPPRVQLRSHLRRGCGCPSSASLWGQSFSLSPRKNSPARRSPRSRPRPPRGPSSSSPPATPTARAPGRPRSRCELLPSPRRPPWSRATALPGAPPRAVLWTPAHRPPPPGTPAAGRPLEADPPVHQEGPEVTSHGRPPRPRALRLRRPRRAVPGPGLGRAAPAPRPAPCRRRSSRPS